MFDDGNRWSVKFGNQFIGRIGVVKIIETERLTLHLDSAGNAGTVVAGAIKGGGLMWVLAIAHDFGLGTGDHQPVGEGNVLFFSKPVSDGGIIGRRAGIGCARQLPACRNGDAAACRQFLNNGIIIGRFNDDSNMVMIFGRCPDHCRPADINILDTGFIVGTGRQSRFKGV